MNRLYDTKPNSVLLVAIGMILIMISYLLLLYGFPVIALAGVIALYLMYGVDGIKQAFSPIRKGKIKYVVIGTIWSYVQSIVIIGTVMFALNIPLASNASSNIFLDKTPIEIIVHMLVLIVSLIGEECLILIPSIPAIYFLKKHGVNQKLSMIIVTIIGILLFGLAHYTTYNGNLIQIFLLIGVGRLPLNWVAFKTNSLWGSSIVHIIYDFTIFILIPLLHALK